MTAIPVLTAIIFGGLVVGWLILDLFILGRRPHALSLKEAAALSVGLVAVALLFGGHVWYVMGHHRALEYYAGYLVELSLSVDNLFVFLVIFHYFKVPAALQPKVLNWGVIGAMVMRALMIGVGTLILERYHWVIYLLGAALLFTAWRMFHSKGIQIEPENNPVLKLARRFLRVSPQYDGARFFTKSEVGWLATPLFLVVLVVEWTDVVFAIDSIPAIFAVTRDPFIVYTSNIFAILGLRALFFVLADALDRFYYLKAAITLILGFVGLKMLLSAWVTVPILVSLSVILVVLGTAIVLSIKRARRLAPS